MIHISRKHSENIQILTVDGMFSQHRQGFDWGCVCVCVLVTQSCLTLCNSMDCSPPGFSVHGILQARILEWVAMPSSRGFSQPRDQAHVCYVSCIGRQVLYYQRYLGSPILGGLL